MTIRYLRVLLSPAAGNISPLITTSWRPTWHMWNRPRANCWSAQDPLLAVCKDQFSILHLRFSRIMPGMPTPRRHTILVVDDEPDVVQSVKDLLRLEYNVLGTTKAEEAVKLMQEHEINV